MARGRRRGRGRRVGRGPERTHPGRARRPPRPPGVARAPRQPARAARSRPGVRLAGDRVFSLERGGGQKQLSLVVRPVDEPAAAARLLVDPAALSADAATAIDWYHPSLDGRLVAYGVSEGGDERSVLRVLDVETGKHLSDEIPETRAASVALAAGRHGFLYTRYPAGDSTTGAIYRHRLGEPWADDELVWAELPTPESWADVATSPDGRFALVTALVGWARTDVHLRDEQSRRVADAHRGRRRDHLRPASTATGWSAVTTLDAPAGPGGRHPPRPRRAARGVDDARARGRGRHPARRAGRRRPAGRHHRTRPPARITRHAPDGAVVGEVALPELVLGGRARRRRRPVAGLRAARGLHPSGQPLPLDAAASWSRARRARSTTACSTAAVRRVAGALPVGRRHRDRAVPRPPRRRAARRGHALHPHRLRRVRHRRDAGVVTDHRGVGRGRRAVRRRRAAGRLRGGRGVAPGRPPRAQAARLRRLPRRRRPPRRRRGAPRGTGWPSGAAPTAGCSSAWP